MESSETFWECIMRLVFSGSLALLIVVSLAQAGQAQDNPYQDLLRRLPDSTNALVVADVEGLRKALGVPPGTSLMAGDVSSLPVMAKRFVFGAHVDLGDRHHLWSIAMAKLTGPLSIADLAKMENAQVEEVAGTAVMESPRNAFFVDLGPELLAVGTPANRQQLKHWLTRQKNNPLPALSPYLLQVAKSADANLITMAVDLSDCFSLTSIKRGLKTSRVLTDKSGLDSEAVAKTLAKASGIRLTVRQGDGYPLHGELAVDFTTDTDAVRNFSKSLLLEILERADLLVSDFNSWRALPKQESIGIQGPLSLNGLRKFGALIRTPAPPPQAANLQTYQSLNPGAKSLDASKRYFKTVKQLLADLQSEKGSTKRMAGWYSQFANQIDNLPMLDVDPDLLNYGATTSQMLRSMGASLQGIVTQSGQLQKEKNWVVASPAYYGPWGYPGNVYNVTTGAAYLQQESLVTQGKQARVELWEKIDQETANIRRHLTEKYQTEF
jgi:hypothetical protein